MELSEMEARLLNAESAIEALNNAVFGQAEEPSVSEEPPGEEPPGEEPLPEPSPAAPAPAGPNLRFVAGVIRCPVGGKWGVIEDEGHAPLNIKKVYLAGNRVVVEYSFTAKKVISLMASPDEYYTQMGVSCGASVGRTSAAVYFNKRPATGYADPMSLQSNLANVWLFGVFEV